MDYTDYEKLYTTFPNPSIHVNPWKFTFYLRYGHRGFCRIYKKIEFYNLLFSIEKYNDDNIISLTLRSLSNSFEPVWWSTHTFHVSEENIIKEYMKTIDRLEEKLSTKEQIISSLDFDIRKAICTCHDELPKLYHNDFIIDGRS